MKIGIDASNLRQGGGRTHLVELLRNADGVLGDVDEVVVWGSAETLSRLPTWSWLTPSHQSLLDGPLPSRLLWQHTVAVRLARHVDLLFAPGGVASPLVRPRVVMSQNLLPFSPGERLQYGRSRTRMRLELLRVGQARNFASADGVIFLTEYARRQITAMLPAPPRRVAVIPHGVADRFRMTPRPPRALDELTVAAPLRVLYVSQVAPYKHQAEVIEAIHRLNAEVPAELTLVGVVDASPYAARAMRGAVRDGLAGAKVRSLGQIPFEELHRVYAEAEVFVFASSCENMPNILLEAMSSALPIACSSRGPMPEILGDAGVYFDPTQPAEIAAALRMLAADPALRSRLAEQARQRAQPFDWRLCARDTFAFLSEVALSYHGASATRAR